MADDRILHIRVVDFQHVVVVQADLEGLLAGLSHQHLREKLESIVGSFEFLFCVSHFEMIFYPRSGINEKSPISVDPDGRLRKITDLLAPQSPSIFIL